MCNRLIKRFGFLLVASGFIFANPCHAQKVDLNENGMSDVWELIHAASGANPNLDSDGDGVNNPLEALAGTDPFDAASVPSIPMCTRSSTNFTVNL